MCCNSPSHEDARPWTETYPYNSGVGVLVPHVPAEGVVSLFGGDQGHKRSQDEAWFNRTRALMRWRRGHNLPRRKTVGGHGEKVHVPRRAASGERAPDTLTVGFQAPGLRDSVYVNWLCLGCRLGPSPALGCWSRPASPADGRSPPRGLLLCPLSGPEGETLSPPLRLCSEPLPQPGTGLAWGGTGGGLCPQGAAWGSSVRPHGAAQA